MPEKKAVRGGSFCGPIGATAETTAGTPVACTLKEGEKQGRWRRTGDTPKRTRARGRQPAPASTLTDARAVTPVALPTPAAPDSPVIPTQRTPEEPVQQPPMPARSPEPIRPPNGEWGVDQGLMHFDGACGVLWNRLGDDRHLEVDGRALGNVVCDLGEGITRKKHDTNHVLAELRRVRTQVPDGTAAAGHLDKAINRLDAPNRPAPPLPDDAPPQLRTLMSELNNINLVRRGRDVGFPMSSDGTYETDKLADIAARWSRGELRRSGLEREIDDLRGMRHESMEGWMEIRTAIGRALADVRVWGRRA
jgi:hypothetical protein